MSASISGAISMLVRASALRRQSSPSTQPCGHVEGPVTGSALIEPEFPELPELLINEYIGKHDKCIKFSSFNYLKQNMENIYK